MLRSRQNLSVRKFRPSPEDYWKLDPADGGEDPIPCSRGIINYLCQHHGYEEHSLQHRTRSELSQIAFRAQRDLLRYEDLNERTLRNFCRDRKLLQKMGDFTHKECIQKLEDADERVTFTRFIELPAELRVEVYKWHFAQLQTDGEKRRRRVRVHDGEGPLPQAPIAKVSRRLRAEALPIFCDEMPPVFHIVIHHNWNGVPRARFTSKGERFVEQAANSAVQRISSFRLRIGPGMELGCASAWSVEMGERDGSLAVRELCQEGYLSRNGDWVNSDSHGDFDQKLRQWVKGKVRRMTLRKGDLEELLRVFGKSEEEEEEVVEEHDIWASMTF